jgi:hypothetical protein
VIIDNLDLGPYQVNLAQMPIQTNRGSEHGQVAGSVQLEQSRELRWARGRKAAPRTETVYVEAPTALGGSAAGTQGALQILVRQLQELCDQPQAHVVLWRSGNGRIVADTDDGWWLVENCVPDMDREASGWAPVTMTFTRVAPLTAPIQVAQFGGAMASTYAGSAVTDVWQPVGSTALAGTALTRVGGEGTIVGAQAPPNPLPGLLAATIANWFKGGCHVYDTIATATYPVPIGYAPMIIADGPVSYWRLDDTGTVANDFIALNDGTLHGTITTVVAGALTGDADTAMTFDGSTGYISIPYVAALNPAAFTLECWFKYSAAPGTNRYLMDSDPGSNLGWRLLLTTSGALSFQVGNGATYVQTGSGVLSTNVWHHVVATNDGANSRLYVDGLLVGGPTAAVPSVNTSGQMTIGAATGVSNFVPASIDEVAVYASALSQAQVTNHYNAGLGTNTNLNVNANWVEVFSPGHTFVGDALLTNGQLMLLLVANAAKVAAIYLWTTSLPTASWQNVANLLYADAAGNNATLRTYALQKVGMEGVEIIATASTSGQKAVYVRLRQKRGKYHCFADLDSLSEALSGSNGLELQLVSTGLKSFVYNETSVSDLTSASITQTTLNPSANYGYAAFLAPYAGWPFIVGLLWQNAPSTRQPQQVSTATPNPIIAAGDSPAQNAWTTYGFFAIPYASPQNLQAEAEGGALGTGWSSQADAAASGGATAKLASGTSNILAVNPFPSTDFTPVAGSYLILYRLKVTSAASSTVQFALDWIDVTAGSATIIGTGDVAPNGYSTALVWHVISASPTTPTAAHATHFRARQHTNATNTDWFLDEVIIVPITNGNYFPQDIWQEFMADIDARWARQTG